MPKDIWSRSVFLTPTDTTVGFISKSNTKLDKAKDRLPNKNYITALPSLKSLRERTRVPNIHKNRVRRAKQTTFIFKNGKSYRVIKDNQHIELIKKLKWAYTSSANLSGENFNKEFAEDMADIIISYPRIKEIEIKASKIYFLGNFSIYRTR